MSKNDSGALYVVATPIGNLKDLSARAEEVLKAVQIVAAEDTRRAGVLLNHIGHRAPELVSMHDHNEARAQLKLLDALEAGADVAVVSDAGTPLINDPGFALVRSAHQAGVRVIPVPGASAITAALSVCPLPCAEFTYRGFLPAKGRARRDALTECVRRANASVFFEAPHRIDDCLALLDELAPDRPLMVARELTKQHETIYVGLPGEVRPQVAARGEFVCVLAAQDVNEMAGQEVALLSALLDELPPSRAAKVAASVLGTKRGDMYALAQRLADE